MQHNKVTLLVAPALQNSSCTHARYNHVTIYTGLTPWHLLQAIIVSSLTTGVLVANMLLIFVINSRRYAKYIHSQPRYLLTSLASNHIAMGLLVTPFAIVPSLRNCWPYGELACQIQALLRGAISHQSAVILICMALDRYLCMLHPARYHKHSSKKGCVAVISITWIISITIFSILVLPRGGFYFNSTGMIACEPFYSRPSIRILTACGFYFPTTMILMYCYGSAFHVNKLRLLTSGCNTIATPTPQNIRKTSVEKLVIKERRLSTTASRTMAAMSLGFIVLVTPWTIQEVVAACTGSRAPAPLDFLATWLALSNSFWNPFLYWLLNNHFRRISRELLINILFCRRQSTSSNKQQYHSNSSSGTLGVAPTFDLECLSEKYWGEILEHTLSSNSSLHTLQRSHGNNGSRNNQNRSMPCYYNGLQQHEMKVLDTAVPDSSIQKSINPYPT